MSNKKNLLIIVLTLFFIILVINFVFGQNQKLTLFKTENKGFKFITNQLPNLEFKLSSDNFSAYMSFGYNTLTSGLNNPTISVRTIIRPSHYGGSYIYSETPNNYGGKKYIMMNMRPTNSSTIFLFNDTSREGLERLAKIYANIESSIAIYNCSWNAWLIDNPRYTCLGKAGYYKDGTAPPGASSTDGYDGGLRIYINPSTCFGNSSGRVLQEICTGDCEGYSDDSALTICVLNQQ